MDVPLKKTSSGKRPKKKRFQGNMYRKKSLSEKGIISFENVSPNKSSSVKKLPSAHKISKAYENVVSAEFQVSGDGTWKTHGHTSLIGVCALIGADCGKVLDMEVMSSLIAKDVTPIKGQSDGDSKTFLSIAEKKPYGDSVPIEKIECVGPVQKRMGSRLRKLKALWGEKKLSDGKTIGGKGRLTDAIISKLTTFYGNAIRANSHNVNEMRQAVWAVWAHTSSTDDEPKHWFCPKGKNSWSGFGCAENVEGKSEISNKSFPDLLDGAVDF
ncbi:uncharacterized protein TNCV_1439761 [Trichonephila clavipes]|nr:uncharacterized protein TNCV_1439761 [Trichonephila clavipes]